MGHPHILVFDSGVGGLSVVAEINRVLPAVRVSYLADTAFLPYGTKEESVLIERVALLVGAMAQSLRPDLVVIACNTASTVCLPRLRAHLRIPVVGVVPAVKPAAELSVRRVIGLLGTVGTVRRRYTQELIDQFAPDCRVIRVGSPVLVQMAEAALAGRAMDHGVIRQELAPFCLGNAAERPDVIVLACTHFPLIRQILLENMPAGVQLIDSGRAIAARVQDLLPGVMATVWHEGGDDQSEPHRIFVTDDGGLVRDQQASFAQMGFGQVQVFDRF